MDNGALNQKHTEFETKYSVDSGVLNQFKQIMQGHAGTVDFIYVEGFDDYFVKENGFWRYRTESWEKGEKKDPAVNSWAELTKKITAVDAKNNISRLEYNLTLKNSTRDTVEQSLSHDGYRYNFSIHKFSHIYRTVDATVVFYSVMDTTPGSKKPEQSFVEIEILEDIVSMLSPEECMSIIRGYEQSLEPIGIKPQSRMRKSLFDMYRR